MGYIYIIKNKINGKSYVGQTITPIKERWRKHVSNSVWKKKLTGVDAAIKKYGPNNFDVQMLCECDNKDLDELEIYYIKEFDTFYNGYNLTKGGQLPGKGTSLDLNPSEVIQKYSELKSITSVAKYYNCCHRTISNLLHANHVKITKPICNVENLKNGNRFPPGYNAKKIKILDNGMIFKTLKDCAIWLIKNNYCKSRNMEMVRKNLSLNINHNKRCYGFTIVPAQTENDD